MALGVAAVCAHRGDRLAPGPTVVVTDAASRPQAGLTVIFTVTLGGGTLDSATATSDANGIATAGAWRLGPQPGVNAVSANVATGAGAGFRVNTAAGPAAKLIARLDLETVGGQPLPISYSGSAWDLTGGHYFLAADGTYEFGYEVYGPVLPPLGAACSLARYEVVSPTTVRFYLPPGTYPASTFYQERGGLFATATVRGDRIIFVYEDFLDFEDEVYVLAAGALPTPR
jgi:hypothetical protein